MSFIVLSPYCTAGAGPSTTVREYFFGPSQHTSNTCSFSIPFERRIIRRPSCSSQQVPWQKMCIRDRARGTVEYYVSDSTEQFDRLAHVFLGEYAGGRVQRIDIEAYRT